MKIDLFLLVNQTLNAVVQVLLFAAVPFFWWLVTARKKETFAAWLGFKKPGRPGLPALTAGCFVLLFAAGQLALLLRGDMAAADSAYKGMGLAAVPAILVYAFGQTALSEEILFRGFLMKRLQARWGFAAAAAVQAVIFGALHLLMVWGQTDLLSGTVIVVYPALAAVVLCWINEKKANGSIYPSWILHGLLNAVSGILQALQ